MKRGFTLIELLVVIAILAAILLSVFGKAREEARQSSCLSSMAKVGVALLAYANDNDQVFPPTQTTPPWLKLRPYLTSAIDLARIDDTRYVYFFDCASDSRIAPNIWVGTAQLIPSWGFREEAFSSSCYAIGRNNYPIVLDYSGETGLWRQSTIGEITPDNMFVNLPENRHNEGINILFHDGHARWDNVRLFAATKISTGEYSKPLGYPPTKMPELTPTPLLPKAFVGKDGIIRDAEGNPMYTTK